MNKRLVGKEKEDLAVEFLGRHGIEVIERNYSCRTGEVDIIAVEGDTLVFIEVKYRSSLKYGYPEENVDLRKQKKICSTAIFYISSHHYDGKIRFDVISIVPDRIKLIRNAFSYI
ncbi:MAG: YraN family protein [Lachnospiraceae bacterium]|jgi:putative endonuclease|nr:YraN family protein [Lachnospiraceae bacterium]MDD5956130.1 YraN family protein [Lachnospiraceae bacterium]MDY3991749.1 YraN family protein [Lachnospiraceae bacterium]